MTQTEALPGEPQATGESGQARVSLRTIPMILMYHAVAQTAEDPNQLCVPPAVFAAQMSWLTRRGLRGVSITTLLDAMQTGHHRRMVGITFDDGYQSVLEQAVPELQRYGFGATAFIIADRIGGTNDWDDGPTWPLLSADGVRELAAAGIEIGSHSATHPRLAGICPDQLPTEIAGSRASLGALLGTQIRGFAYPYGAMDASARAAVCAAGYDYACAVSTSVSDIGVMALPRLYVGRLDGPARMLAKRILYRGHIALKGRHQ
jgi:peptidoglycan/xylan/chitin deacetylase (PgdA/CDA1 family)